MTCEIRTSPALERFDEEASHNRIFKWWLRTNDRYSLHCEAHDAHSGEVTALLSNESSEASFITASLDGTFKCWQLASNNGENDDTRGIWQCTGIGGWHSRPVLSGCCSSDGSILVLGFRGFVVLWEPRSVTELDAIAVGEVSDEVTQLSCSMACGRFLMLATLADTNGREKLVCWDLQQLEFLTSIDIADVLPGKGLCICRLLPLKNWHDDLHVLLFRSSATGKTIEQNFGTDLQLWRLRDGGLKFESVSSIALPPAHAPRDAVMITEGRALCWTVDFELWDVDIVAGKANPHGTEDIDDGVVDIVKSKLARVISDRDAPRKNTSLEEPRLHTLLVRTTATQQAGLTKQFMHQVLPAHAPSHMLPPPASIWSSFLSAYGKPLAESTVNTESDANYNGSTIPDGRDIGVTWGKKPEEQYVDADWMDELVKGSVA